MRTAAALLGLAAALGAGACRTQLWPRPMTALSDPLPAGIDADVAPGPTEVLLLRHADPVLVRRAESPTGFPLTYRRKDQRIRSSTWVHCGAGGRAEIVWPPYDAKVLLIGEAVCRVGEPQRGEPALRFLTVERLEIELGPGAVVELPGGCVLSGPPDAPTGPYLVERTYEEVLRVFNRSKGPAFVAYRDASIALAPGERVDLPCLGAGTAPFDPGGLARSAEAAGIRGEAFGEATLTAEGDGLRADGAGLARAVGVGVRLERGDVVRFRGLGSARPQTAPQPSDQSITEP